MPYMDDPHIKGGDNVYRFPSRRGVCAQKYCGKPMILRNPSNVPAYCDYACAVAGQPEYTAQGRDTDEPIEPT